MIVVTTHNHLGDSAILTAAVYNVRMARPDIDIRYNGWAKELWKNLSFTAVTDVPAHFSVGYGTLFDEQNSVFGNCVAGFTHDLCEKLQIPCVPLASGIPVLRLTEEEKATGAFCRGKWIINANAQTCSCSKWYPHWQKVVDMLQGKVSFVQVGSTERKNISRGLSGVLDYRGMSQDLRQFLSMIWNCDGIVSPPSGIMNLAAAFGKPQVIVNAAREAARLSDYPGVACVSCAYCGYNGLDNGCVTLLMPGSEKSHRRCTDPVMIDGIQTAACMASIHPESIAEKIISRV